MTTHAAMLDTEGLGAIYADPLGVVLGRGHIAMAMDTPRGPMEMFFADLGDSTHMVMAHIGVLSGRLARRVRDCSGGRCAAVRR